MSKSSYKPIRSQTEYESNPFIEKTIEEVKAIKRTQFISPTHKAEVQMIVNMETGEQVGHSAFMRYIEVDDDKFTKLYLSEFAAFWDLTKPALRVFGYIINQIKPNSDRFMFDVEECKKYTQYNTYKSIIEGLNRLIDCGIIARSKKHYMYFINPMMFFNGNRLTFAKTYVKKVKKISDENQLSLDFDNDNK